MGGDPAGRQEWVDRFAQQARACEDLGSPLWARVLRIVGDDVGAGGAAWDLIAQRAGLRFGQAGPLRLVGALHRLALAGDAPRWSGLLPSCGGVAPAPGRSGDGELRAAWAELVADRGTELVAGLDREVQTNEVGRSAALAYAHAVSFGSMSGDAHGRRPERAVRLVELGCSGGLNLRLDRFRSDLTGAPGGGRVLGDPTSRVRLAPEMRAPLEPGLVDVAIGERVGIDPNPIDPTADDGRLTLLSFVWPDQVERFARLAAAIEVARDVPARLVGTGSRDTAEVLAEVLAGSVDDDVATVVQHSIVWQYVATDRRPAITAAIESAGAGATHAAPLVWVRYEPDEWDRTRAAVWTRCWPGGRDRLVAHADYHGRWLRPVPVA